MAFNKLTLMIADVTAAKTAIPDFNELREVVIKHMQERGYFDAPRELGHPMTELWIDLVVCRFSDMSMDVNESFYGMCIGDIADAIATVLDLLSGEL